MGNVSGSTGYMFAGVVVIYLIGVCIYTVIEKIKKKITGGAFMANVIIVLALALIVFNAIKATKKHMKGESSCCGGGGEIYQVIEDKKLENPIIKEKVFKVKGMTCQHCVANVTRAINAIDGVNSQVNLKKEEAHVVYDRDVDDQVIISAIKQAGYDVQ